jgi:pyridoxine 5-phosphate synthase
VTKLSVNINKFATLRNARGGNNPDLLQVAIDAQTFGADGITVHPRPDERHIRYADVRNLRPLVHTEFNIEGNCREQKFIDLVLEVKPEQVTLVPDATGQLTSDHGWDTLTHSEYLKGMVQIFQQACIRVSLFIDPVADLIKAAADTGTDRIELYTEQYAQRYATGKKEEAVLPYVTAAALAKSLNLGINAGHDLDRLNLKFLHEQIPYLDEVSIGHALICDAIYLGFENTIQLYKRQLTESSADK